MKYGEVLLGAARITWKHKFLCLPQILLSTLFLLLDQGMDLYVIPGLYGTAGRAAGLFLVLARYWRLFCIFGIYLAAFLLFLCAAAPVIVILGTFHADRGSKPAPLAKWAETAGPYFWRMLGLWLVLFLLGSIFVIAGYWLNDVITRWTGGASASGQAGLAFLLLFLMLPWSAFAALSSSELILADSGVRAALARGKRLLSSSLAASLGMAFLLSLLSFVSSHFVSGPEGSILPRLTAALAGASPHLRPAWPSIALALGFLLASGFVQGAVASYYYAAWTLAYLRLSRSAGEPASTEPAHA